MMGDSVMATPDIARTNCLVLSGMRPHESSPRTLASIVRRRQQVPLKLIVIDPIVTRIARDADIHLQIRPGTDTALFMGWINVIISESLYDKEFVISGLMDLTNWSKEPENILPNGSPVLPRLQRSE
jgi:anaerobic selenocysteine-containing dehydrogenase